MSNAGRPFKEVSQASAAYYVTKFLNGTSVSDVVSGLLFHAAAWGKDNPDFAKYVSNEYKTLAELEIEAEKLFMDALFGTNTLPKAFLEIFQMGAAKVAADGSLD